MQQDKRNERTETGTCFTGQEFRQVLIQNKNKNKENIVLCIRQGLQNKNKDNAKIDKHYKETDSNKMKEKERKDKHLTGQVQEQEEGQRKGYISTFQFIGQELNKKRQKTY